MSQLTGNSFLSKDHLTKVRNSIYFNNSDDYLATANLSNTCLLGLSSDCAIYFVQLNTTKMSLIAKAAMKRTRGSRQKVGDQSMC